MSETTFRLLLNPCFYAFVIIELCVYVGKYDIELIQTFSLVNVSVNLQKFDNGMTDGQDVDCYKASYQPHKPARQPNMFIVQSSHQNGHFDQLQRDFLDSSPSK